MGQLLDDTDVLRKHVLGVLGMRQLLCVLILCVLILSVLIICKGYIIEFEGYTIRFEMRPADRDLVIGKALAEPLSGEESGLRISNCRLTDTNSQGGICFAFVDELYQWQELALWRLAERGKGKRSCATSFSLSFMAHPFRNGLNLTFRQSVH